MKAQLKVTLIVIALIVARRPGYSNQEEQIELVKLAVLLLGWLLQMAGLCALTASNQYPSSSLHWAK